MLTMVISLLGLSVMISGQGDIALATPALAGNVVVTTVPMPVNVVKTNDKMAPVVLPSIARATSKEFRASFHMATMALVKLPETEGPSDIGTGLSA